MPSVVAPYLRRTVPDRVRTSLAVSASEWTSAAELAGWIQSRGGVAVPASHVGLEVSTSAATPTRILDTSLTDVSYGWWREPTVSCAVLIGGHASAYATVDVEIGDGTTVYETATIVLGPGGDRSQLIRVDLPTRGGEALLAIDAVASVAGAVIDVVQVFEQPRSRLELDALDMAVLPASCSAHGPIQDNVHLSVRGAVDAYLYADARRQSYFRELSRDNPVVIETSSKVSEVAIFPFGIPMQAPVLYPGDVVRDDIIVAIDARFDPDGGLSGTEATLHVTTDSGGSSLAETVSDSGAWATYTFRPDIACEDLDSADGRRSSAWEMLRIAATVAVGLGNVPRLEIGAVAVFSTNAQGESGFAASTYYAQDSTEALEGSDAMTPFALIYLGAGSGTRIIMEHLAPSGGWALFIDSSNQAVFQTRDGSGTYSITSAALTEGMVYALMGAWDGANLNLTVNQTDVAAVAGGFVVAGSTRTASLGAQEGVNPASGVIILGAGLSASVALSSAQRLEQNAVHTAVADVRKFGGCEHLYSARFGLHTDLIGDAHWTRNGSTTLERFVPRIG